MPHQELKLAVIQADITCDEPVVQSEPKQDLKQFGDFSIGEIAEALGVPKTSVHYWVKDVSMGGDVTPEIQAARAERRKAPSLRLR